jgi:hypothetical protein
VDDRGVAEAQVDSGRAGDAVQGGVQRRQAVAAGGVGPGLQVRLVDLDDVGAGREQVADLGVHRRGVAVRGRLGVRVVVVLGLLGHRERARHGDLDGAVGVRAEELQVAHLDGAGPVDRADDPGHRVRVPAAVQGGAGVVDVHPVQRGREVVGVALPADLAVGEQVQPGLLLGADREHRRVVLGLREVPRGRAPQLLRPHPRGGTGRRAPPGR